MAESRNRPIETPRIPGTDLRSPDVPLAIIRRPTRAATQSAPRPRHWVLEFEPASASTLDPLLGWMSSADPYRSIRLTFPDAASAIRFAEANDWRYIVLEDGPRPARPRRRNCSPRSATCSRPGSKFLSILPSQSPGPRRGFFIRAQTIPGLPIALSPGVSGLLPTARCAPAM